MTDPEARLARLELRPLEGRGPHCQPGHRHGEAEQDSGHGEARRAPAEGPFGDVLHGHGDAGSDHRADGAVGVEGRTRVVAERHLGLDREVGDREHRHRDAQQAVGEGVVCEERVLGRERSIAPEQREGGAVGNGADQEVRPPASSLPSRVVRDASHHRIREGVDGASHQRDQARQRRPQLGDLGQEVGGVDDAEGREAGVDRDVAE